MTPVQQQRLVGLGLLLFLISVVAFFLISSANQNHQAEVEQIAEQDDDFASLVEPIGEEKLEVVSPQEEALVDPHSLGETQAKSSVVKQQADSVKQDLKQAVITPKPKPEPEKLVTEVKKVAPVAPKTVIPSERWTAQLASFSLKANADALAEKVKSQGYDVELLTGKSGSKTIYRVRLQSETNKASIEQKAAALKKSMKLSPQVFKVTN